jgi:hypothetical protein
MSVRAQKMTMAVATVLSSTIAAVWSSPNVAYPSSFGVGRSEWTRFSFSTI